MTKKPSKSPALLHYYTVSTNYIAVLAARYADDSKTVIHIALQGAYIGFRGNLPPNELVKYCSNILRKSQSEVREVFDEIFVTDFYQTKEEWDQSINKAVSKSEKNSKAAEISWVKRREREEKKENINTV